MANVVKGGGGCAMNPALSNDEKGVNNTYTFTFGQAHKNASL